MNSCRRLIPLGLQGFPIAYALGTREVRSASLCLTVHHRVTGEGERAQRGGGHGSLGFRGVTANVTDARFICKGGREREAPLGSQRSAGRHSLRARGRRTRASKGPWGVGRCVNHKQSGEQLQTPGLHLRPGPEQRPESQSWRGFNTSASFLLLHTWGDKDPLGDMLQVTRPLVSGL